MTFKMNGWSPFNSNDEEKKKKEQQLIKQGFKKGKDGYWRNKEGLTPNQVKHGYKKPQRDNKPKN